VNDLTHLQVPPDRVDIQVEGILNVEAAATPRGSLAGPSRRQIQPGGELLSPEIVKV
jgi:hypothetical protein